MRSDSLPDDHRIAGPGQGSEHFPNGIAKISLPGAYVAQVMLAANAAEPTAAAATTEPAETREQRDARFGMFIHWGVCSVPASVHRGTNIGGPGEWIQNRARISSAEHRKYVEQCQS